MMAIIAMLSDLPSLIAEMVTKLTGADMSAFIDMFDQGFAKIVELIATYLPAIG